MAIDYAAQSALGKDPVFMGRVQVSCINLATAIQLEAASTPAHTSRMRWAAATSAEPYSMAVKVSNAVVTDPAVVEAGAEIVDAALQAAVQVTIESKFI